MSSCTSHEGLNQLGAKPNKSDVLALIRNLKYFIHSWSCVSSSIPAFITDDALIYDKFSNLKNDNTFVSAKSDLSSLIK